MFGVEAQGNWADFQGSNVSLFNPAFRNHDLEPVSERYVRYLAAAGRVALRNIERYLDTHPAEQQRLEMKVLEPKSWGEEFDLDEADFVEDPFGSVG